MSRSGYIEDDYEYAALYRGCVARAIRGKRGQRALIDIISALDEMPDKKLIASSFSCEEGDCVLGAMARKRGVNMDDLEVVSDEFGDDTANSREVGRRLEIAPSMAAEAMYENDEGSYNCETPEQRWTRMRSWAVSNLKKED